MATILKKKKNILRFSSGTESQIDWKLARKYPRDCRSEEVKIVLVTEIQDGRYGCHLENLFCASTPETKER